MTTQLRSERSFTVGRAGIKIPALEAADGTPQNVRGFLQGLWKLNGVARYGQYGHFSPAYTFGEGAEMVVPASIDKPLVSIRGDYWLTDDEERRQDWLHNERYGDDNPEVITMARERQQIRLAPEAGSLAYRSLLQYDSRHTGAPARFYRESEPPGTTIMWEGELVAQERRHKIAEMLAATVELLS